ncbi:MAG TPA: class I SAM-dependent methyltransferase [Bosea sp. (in: a-proteobacteria)]|jgi:ubiquinone/menaquinone biosynthesis C-methylase UbiE|uniref:class I SAM-dependent methyltransferase n=1 Tax=Bosea sp. (in: a-proteobacteria) TaxID=1871050 RepID=UPI002E1142B4|nr:class I SAM-dependent methyltransferase [Bosea sp. (in: a-proteobacteria)]
MSTASDARFWDRSSRRYARSRISDQAGYERTLERVRALLKPGDTVLELGCGTGTTALRLADGVGSYLATDISSGMIAIAEEKRTAGPVPGLAFRAATAEAVASEGARFDAVLAFNYLHLVRDLGGTLRSVHALLAPGGLFVSKTPCLGDMNPLIRLVLPLMQMIGQAPYAGIFSAEDLSARIAAAGFEVLSVERHASKGKDSRPFIVARRK